MIFSSYIFLFGFLPVFLLVYYLMPVRFRSAWILFASYAFYGWWRLDFLPLLIAITVVTYALALGIERSSSLGSRRQLLTVGVVLNLGALAYFKYANFGVDSFNAVMKMVGSTPFSWTPVLLPIGLSFFIFHAISYLVDIYRKEAEPTRNLIDFAAFIALFPHLIAGPVLRYHLLAEQFRSRTHSLEKFGQGTMRFMVGFSKKVLIADSISPLADAAFALPNPTMADGWLGILAYTLQIYFDFSGYSDMAIGLALMIGFKFPENFNQPYISRSITEFWRRWHISLSSWLREYLYISLGGNRKGVARTYFNLFITMVLGGLWHGANWTFVLWGVWHGGVLALERYLGSRYKREAMPAWVTIPGTMILVMIGWVLFRAPNVQTAFGMYGGMIGLNGFSLSEALSFQLTGLQLASMLLASALVYAGGFLSLNPKPVAPRFAWALVPLFLLAALRLAAQDYSPFLYFQF